MPVVAVDVTIVTGITWIPCGTDGVPGSLYFAGRRLPALAFAHLGGRCYHYPDVRVWTLGRTAARTVVVHFQ